MSTLARSREEPRGAQRRARPGLRGWLRVWIGLHLYGLFSSLGRLLGRPWATVLTVGVMAVALALPLGLWLLLANLERFAGHVRDAREIGVFLRPDLPTARAKRLAAEVGAWPEVAAVSVRTPDEGLAEFRAMSDLAPALDLLEHNPLPPVLLVAPRGDAPALVERLRALPEAEIVQHDALWRQRLDAWLGLGRRGVWVVALLLGIGALLVVGNTVRLDIQSREDEIAVLQLLGASDGFVRRPFLYLGAWYGLAAGLLALGLLMLALLALQHPLSRLIASYGSTFVLAGLRPATAAAIAAGSAGLGWLGALVASGHHLRRTRPTEV